MSAPDWGPSAPLDHLRRRAEILQQVRRFFSARGYLEVETPVLGAAGATDLHLASLSTEVAAPLPRRFYLQTSPELHMKRLLAASSGPIYQLARVFRDGEAGRQHNPEFTMLEWYHPGWDHHALMDEMDELLGMVLDLPAAERLTYAELFHRHLGLDPDAAEVDELATAAARYGVAVGPPAPADADTWRQLLFGELVVPQLNGPRPTYVLDFPVGQASLARVRPGPPAVAERFEVYVACTELANGFHELTDPVEQRRRFAADLAARREAGLPLVAADSRFLAALESGLEPCAGVALGFDRLLMLLLGADRLEQVMAFSIDRA